MALFVEILDKRRAIAVIGLSKKEIEKIFQEKSSNYALSLKSNRDLLQDFVREVIEKNIREYKKI